MAKATKKPTLAPLGDRVLVKPLARGEINKKRPSGIILPETIEAERPQEGTVIAVGKGRYDDGALIPMSVNVGDRIIFSKYGYDEVKIDGVEYFVVKEENILAIIK